jgi:hypothetical protein
MTAVLGLPATAQVSGMIGVYPRVYLSVDPLPGAPVWVLALGGLIALYLGSCFVFPYARCPWCRGRTTVGDGKGHYRNRRACRWCGGAPWRRLGARLMGRG